MIVVLVFWGFVIYLFTYLAVLGLRCCVWDLVP